MVLKLINDRATIENNKQKPRIRIFKGTEKEIRAKANGDEYQISGHDLETFFRIETNDEQIRRILLDKYSNDEEQKQFRARVREINSKVRGKIPLGDDSLFLSQLNILLPYEDIDRTFESDMLKNSTKKDDISGILWKCDREKIYLKYESYIDQMGHKRVRAVESNQECPIKGTLEDCPYGCQKSGILNFYILELLEYGIHDLCSVSVSGFTDIIEITRYLLEIQEQRGTIKKAISSYFTNHSIPYELKRRKVAIKRPLTEKDNKSNQYLRTGKKTNDFTYAIALNINPYWLQWERQNQTINQVQALGYSPDRKLIEQVYDVQVLEAKVAEHHKQLNPVQQPLVLMASRTIERSEEEIREIKALMKDYGWSLEEMTRLVGDEYYLGDLKEIRLLDDKQFEDLKSKLCDREVHKRYEDDF